MEYFTEFKPIPKIFWSFETGAAFQKCNVCGANLMEDGTNYLIEKAFRGKETIFEYAMCFDCNELHTKNFSENSLKLLRHYFSEHVDFKERQRTLFAKHGTATSHWLSHCVIKGTPRKNCQEFQICGHFLDKDIVFTGMPIMLSVEAMDEIVDLLSNETLGMLGDFSDKVLGLDVPKSFMLV